MYECIVTHLTTDIDCCYVVKLILRITTFPLIIIHREFAGKSVWSVLIPSYIRYGQFLDRSLIR